MLVYKDFSGGKSCVEEIIKKLEGIKYIWLRIYFGLGVWWDYGFCER